MAQAARRVVRTANGVAQPPNESWGPTKGIVRSGVFIPGIISRSRLPGAAGHSQASAQPKATILVVLVPASYFTPN